VAIAQDVTETQWHDRGVYQRGVQAALYLRDQAIAASRVGIVIADARLPDMPLIYVNPAFEQMSGYSATEVLGLNCRFLQGPEKNQAARHELRHAIKERRHCTVTLRNFRKDGTLFWNELTISPVFDEAGELTHFVGIQANVTQRIQAEKALLVEKNKSERLLLNVLPRPIADQLKRFEGSLAQQFSSVTILFADLVSFSSHANQFQALELISTLNQIFSVFDQLAETHGVEKIKTIGDAYMAAAGLPLPRADHAEAIAAMALDMQQAIRQFHWPDGSPMELRIGIHTGSVVAGVIGIKKFIYDLWGDAVNVAARMESHGKPQRIQITAATQAAIAPHFICQRRGILAIKGKGPMETYWLCDRRQ
jgi:PAS domain S-box-containing protein